MFYKLINLIKINYNLKKKKLILKYNLSKNDFKIAKLFIQLNIIKIIKKEENKLVIYFTYRKNNPVFYNIKNLYKPSRPFFINLNQILKINKKNNNIFILSTNKGLMTNFEAEKNKVGGILIFTLKI
jgi:ribosomal protein S8